MSTKRYDWKDGVTLQDHTRKKHVVLRRYLRDYLITRCQIPQQERFRLVVVDGFAGAGLYTDGSYGSPLIVVDEIAKTTEELNAKRSLAGMRPLVVECLLILNDNDASAVEELQRNITPILLKARDESTRLAIIPEYYKLDFETLYPSLVRRIQGARCSNVIFNLDQYGYSAVTTQVIVDIMSRWRSAEVFLTFAIQSFLAFLSPAGLGQGANLNADLLNGFEELRSNADELLTKKEWLGTAEQIVFENFRQCAPYVSPFSINNPDGWRYWLMHFANSHRARQVYNDVLHEDSAVQAHFGRAGLNMLAYDPRNEGQLYLFDENSRESARNIMLEEIPSLVAESGDTMSMRDFYATAYSATPAHTDDIHEVIIANPDIEVITEDGGRRRTAGAIRITDTLRLKSQRSLFFMFTGKHKS